MDVSNQNAATQQDADLLALLAQSEKYDERNNKKKRLTKEEILARFFNPRKDTEIFRALPKRGDEEFIEEGYFHKVQGGKYAKNTVTIYCPAKNGKLTQAVDGNGELQFDQQGKPVMVTPHCPMCEKGYNMRKNMDRSISGKKKDQLSTPQEHEKFEKNKAILQAANKYEAKVYYIIRGIDRGAEKDGVKFWRFKHNFKAQGVHDKLWKPIVLGYYKETGRPYNNIEHGIDLMISVVDNEFNGSKYRDVSAIIPRQPSKLHTDDMIMKQWLDDKTTWRDVFKPKKAPGIDETRYLQLASEEREVGSKFDMRNTPYYDEDLKKWIFPNHPELEAAANTRNQNLDADDEVGDDENVPASYASAAIKAINETSAVDITTMPSQPTPAPQFNHGAVTLGAAQTAAAPTPTIQAAPAPVAPAAPVAGGTVYDDLPF